MMGMMGGGGGYNGNLAAGTGMNMSPHQLPIIGNLFENPNEKHQQMQMLEMARQYGRMAGPMQDSLGNALRQAGSAAQPYNNMMGALYGEGAQLPSGLFADPVTQELKDASQSQVAGSGGPFDMLMGGGPMGMMGGMMGGGGPMGMMGGGGVAGAGEQAGFMMGPGHPNPASAVGAIDSFMKGDTAMGAGQLAGAMGDPMGPMYGRGASAVIDEFNKSDTVGSRLRELDKEE